MKFLLLLFVVDFVFATPAFARVEVACLEIVRRDGSLLQLEPGGRFAHVAIRVGTQWLHANPRGGVELTSDLSSMGRIARVLVNEHAPEITHAQIAPYLHQRFDSEFHWDDPDKTYCSKLVANILAIEPDEAPMLFAAPGWASLSHVARGDRGISPDELCERLTTIGFDEQPIETSASVVSCEDLLR